jgi:hypothetical protein
MRRSAANDNICFCYHDIPAELAIAVVAEIAAECVAHQDAMEARGGPLPSRVLDYDDEVPF